MFNLPALYKEEQNMSLMQKELEKQMERLKKKKVKKPKPMLEIEADD